MSVIRIFTAIAALALTAVSADAQEHQPTAEVTRRFVIPAPLPDSARIAIITPASAIKDKLLDNALIAIQERGFRPVVMPCAYGNGHGSYAADDTCRAADFMRAFTDDSIDAVLCSRGGYGTVQLLPLIDIDSIKAHPKWLIGYSDITDLHAVMHHAGIASIHGPMCSHIGDCKADTTSTNLLFEMLTDSLPFTYEVPAHPYNHMGSAHGTLVGGNFITANGLSGTKYDVLDLPAESNSILYIEEVGEAIYAVERMLIRLHQCGALGKYKGIVLGEFTTYKPSDDFETMEDMFYYWLTKWGYYDRPDYPIIYEFPAGHGDINYPLILNAPVSVSSLENKSIISFDK